MRQRLRTLRLALYRPNGAMWGLAHRGTAMMPEGTQGATSYPQLAWRPMPVPELGGEGSGA
jgi:hypothetical protein